MSPIDVVGPSEVRSAKVAVVERAVEGKPGVDVSYEGKPGDEVDGVVAIVERSVVGKPGVDVS